MTTESIPVLLHIEKSRFQAFLEMLKLFDFVTVESKFSSQQTAEQMEFAEGLREALHEVELDAQGVIKLRDAKELIRELKAMAEA